MQLNVNVGDTVVARLAGLAADGVSPVTIPEGTSFLLTSNDPSVATVPPSTEVPVGGAALLPDIPVTIVGIAGSTDINFSATTPDGVLYQGSATLVVAIPAPGLASISITLVKTN